MNPGNWQIKESPSQGSCLTSSLFSPSLGLANELSPPSAHPSAGSRPYHSLKDHNQNITFIKHLPCPKCRVSAM